MSVCEERSRYKPIFYFMSLGLLFLLIIPLTISIPNCDSPYVAPMGIGELLCRNWLALLAFGAFLIAVILACYVNYAWSGVANPTYDIVEIENVNYEYLTFLTSFIMPLVCMDFTDIRYIIVFLVLLVVIGYIFIKTDLYYGNPTLALMGYRLYRVRIEGLDAPSGIVVITRNRLSEGMAIRWIPIDKNVWVVRRVDNGRHGTKKN